MVCVIYQSEMSLSAGLFVARIKLSFGTVPVHGQVDCLHEILLTLTRIGAVLANCS